VGNSSEARKGCRDEALLVLEGFEESCEGVPWCQWCSGPESRCCPPDGDHPAGLDGARCHGARAVVHRYAVATINRKAGSPWKLCGSYHIFTARRQTPGRRSRTPQERSPKPL